MSLFPPSHPSTSAHAAPTEIVDRIFDYCDLPSLVALCAVSFRALSHAGPVLYRDITITGRRALRSFAKKSRKVRRLPFYVCLPSLTVSLQSTVGLPVMALLSPSQTRSFTYIVTDPRPTRVYYFKAKKPHLFRLPRLVIDVRTASRQFSTHVIDLGGLLNFWDPESVHILSGPSMRRVLQCYNLGGTHIGRELRKVVLTNALLPDSAFLALACRPRLVDIDIDLSNAKPWTDLPDLRRTLADIKALVSKSDQNGPPAYGTVRVIVRDELELAVANEHLARWHQSSPPRALSRSAATATPVGSSSSPATPSRRAHLPRRGRLVPSSDLIYSLVDT